MDKKLVKKLEGKCLFCEESNYQTLDIHRLIPGNEGGKYTKKNTCCCCATCHRKCHAGIIKILGKHYSTAGKYIIHFIDEQGEEKWK